MRVDIKTVHYLVRIIELYLLQDEIEIVRDRANGMSYIHLHVPHPSVISDSNQRFVDVYICIYI